MNAIQILLDMQKDYQETLDLYRDRMNSEVHTEEYIQMRAYVEAYCGFIADIDQRISDIDPSYFDDDMEELH